MKGDNLSGVEADLRRAIAVLADVPTVAADVMRVDEWLELGQFELAYQDLVTIAEDCSPAPEVWTHLQHAQQRMALRPDDHHRGPFVRSVEARTPIALEAATRPDPPTERMLVLLGSARIGWVIGAASPFGSMVVRVESIELKAQLFSTDVVKRGEGRVHVDHRRFWTAVRLESAEDGMLSIIFRTRDRARLMNTLDRFGWSGAVALTHTEVDQKPPSAGSKRSSSW